MNTNYIKKDGFSNTRTEHFFKRLWTPEKLREICNARQHCGVCRSARRLADADQSDLWLLCADEHSHHFVETVHFGFSCARHVPSAAVEPISCPWAGEALELLQPASSSAECSSQNQGPILIEAKDGNRVAMGRFSNTETGEYFHENWTDDRLAEDAAQRKHCGFCVHKIFLREIDFVLCLNPDSPYCYETVNSCFTCLKQQPEPERESGRA